MISLLSTASFLVPLPVFAYIDPGTGSMIFQALIALFISVGVFFKQIKFKLQMMFGKPAPVVPPPAAAPPVTPPAPPEPPPAAS